MKLSISRRTRSAQRRGRSTGRKRPVRPALEWAEDMAGRCPRATAIGSHSLLVENFTDIVDLTDSRIALSSPAGMLRVHGSGLTLNCVSSGGLIVHGSIRRVELPCEEGDPPDER